METELDIIQKHLHQGDKVEVISCDRGLAVCDVNLDRKLHRCAACLLRRQLGYDALEGSVQWHRITKLEGYSKVYKSTSLPENVNSVPGLKALVHDSFDIGYAVASSLITKRRSSDLSLEKNDHNWKYADLYYRTSLAIYEALRNHLKKYQPDRVYIFNGRFAHNRAAMRACESAGIEFWTHERGGTVTKFGLFQNSYIHNIDTTSQAMRKHWESGGPGRSEIAEQFFKERAQRVQDTWKSFTTAQDQGRLPEAWDENRKHIVVFTSSEDEFMAISPQWEQGLFVGQNEGLKVLASLIKEEEEQLVIRIHPNSREALTSIEGFENSASILVEPPDSPVSTYTLVDEADIVVSFGTSVGVEAAFREKPVILLRNCFYSSLGVAARPQTVTELRSMLDNPVQLESAKEGALIFGHFFKSFGQNHIDYEPVDYVHGKYKGTDYWSVDVLKFYRWQVFKSWLLAARKIFLR